MRKCGLFGAVAACAVIVALLMTVFVNDGWVIWLPVLSGLAVVADMRRARNRRQRTDR
jgi:hypothetical protein